MSHSHSDIPETFARLPLFPLQQVLLFPCALLPLHVFEPRYRALTAHCLEHDGLFALAQLGPGFESDYEGRPPVRSVAGLAKIVAHKRNSDGTYHMLVEGLGRVRLGPELPPDQPFREAAAHVQKDVPDPSVSLIEMRQTLMPLLDAIAPHFGDAGHALRSFCEEIDRAACLMDVLSSALIHAPGLRRRLFECSHVKIRAHLLSRGLARLLSELRPKDQSFQN